MNQGRIWCVVHPTVGLPLFLGAVALTSLAVHTAVMTHTSWMSNYWQGASRNRVSENTATPQAAAVAKSDSAFTVTVTPLAGQNAATPASFVITVAPHGVATTTATAPAAGDASAGHPGGVPPRQTASIN